MVMVNIGNIFFLIELIFYVLVLFDVGNFFGSGVVIMLYY